MNKDIDTQFLCKDCARYNLCKYYHERKEDSYICKYFHLESCEDTISRKEAIEVLKNNYRMKALDEIQGLPSVQPKRQENEDCISRQQAIKSIKELFEMGDCYSDKYSIIGTINQMPSIQPKPKTDVLDKIRAELIQSIQNGTLKIESGNEELFRIIDKYKVEKDNQDTVPFDFELYEAGLMDMPKEMIEVLDEIRAEIEQYRHETQDIDLYDLVGDCLAILNKYMPGSKKV